MTAMIAQQPAELKVNLGPMPADEQCGGMIEGLRLLLEKGELCDVILVAGGQSFYAHRSVLASVSRSFHELLMRLGSTGGLPGGLDAKPLLLRLDEVSHPVAVQAMLDCIYGPFAGPPREYGPQTEEANRDVLRLAQRFQLAQLKDQAARWLAVGLTTANVLERLSICEEFGLTDVREKVLEQLIANPDGALFVLAKDPEIRNVPTVLQDLLVRILGLLGAGEQINCPKSSSSGGKSQQSKQARKG